MSAFIVSVETIQKAVTGMLKPGDKADKANELGQKLYAMNADAVEQRYGEREEPPEFRWTPARILETELPQAQGAFWHQRVACERAKAMHCLRYQCSEGDVPERALFHLLTGKIVELESAIVNMLPEYDKAAWDTQPCEA